MNIPYSDEFRERDTNEALLRELAALAPKGGAAGRIIGAGSGDKAMADSDPQTRLSGLLQTDTFRHDLAKATSSQDIWHWLAFSAACLFLADVFVRRVTVNFVWVPTLAARVRDRLLRREGPVAAPVMIERLRSRKAEVTDQLEQRRAATRFEPSPDQPASEAGSLNESPAAPLPPRLAPSAPEPEPESYTSRLLKAKQKVWDEREKDKPSEGSGPKT